MLQGTAGKPREDERFLGADIVEDAQNLDLKVVNLVAGEDRLADSVHTWLDIFQWKEVRLRVKGGGQREDRRDYTAGHNLIVPAGAGQDREM